MSERIFPIGDSPQFNQNPTTGSDLNLLKLTGPSGKEVSVLPIQIDDPAIIEKAMNMNIYGSDGTGNLAAPIAGQSKESNQSELSMNDPIFDQSASSALKNNQLDFSPTQQKSTTASNDHFDFDFDS
ncbi:MAG TPA: hypothetical protein V6C81_20090 [Planktothrix sp.]|jgi:hypothetical protein